MKYIKSYNLRMACSVATDKLHNPQYQKIFINRRIKRLKNKIKGLNCKNSGIFIYAYQNNKDLLIKMLSFY